MNENKNQSNIINWNAFDEDGPFAGLSYDEGAKEFLRRHRMKMTIRRRKKKAKKDSWCQWAFRITKSNGRFLSSYYFTQDNSKPKPYDVLSSLSCDLLSDEDYYEKEIWQPKLKRFFATKKVKEDIVQFV